MLFTDPVIAVSCLYYTLVRKPTLLAVVVPIASNSFAEFPLVISTPLLSGLLDFIPLSGLCQSSGSLSIFPCHLVRL